MRTFLHRVMALGIVAFLAFGFLGSSPEAQARPGDRVSFQTFYNELDAYGRWINDVEYGYVWSPDVGRGFQPYSTRGHWVMTEYGNTWVSDYDWGWAPFHYGRWIFDDYDGWLWIPGTEWGPAWVDWRNGGGYYGWAPMGPRVTYIVPATRWVFVPVMYISSPRIYSYCVPRTRVVNIYHNTTIINNYYERDNRKYVYGPRTQDIERATNRKVNVYRLENESRAGRTAVAENSVKIYRPEINSRREEAPTLVATRDTSAPRTRFAESAGTSTRSDRSTTSGRSRTLDASTGSSRGRSQENLGTSAPSPQPRQESTSEQRSANPLEGRTRQRATGRSSNPINQEGAGEISRLPEVRTAPRTREQPAGMPAPRTRTSSQEAGSRSEGGYAPRRMEAPAQSPAVMPSRTSGNTQPEQTRSRQAASPAPTSAPTTEGGRRGRN